MKNILLSLSIIFLLSSCSSTKEKTSRTTASLGEEIILNAHPTFRDGKKLSKKESAEYGVMIKKVGKNYIWASREDRVLIYNLSGVFHIFTAADGSGMIIISELDRVMGKKKSYPFKIAEHIRLFMDFITYKGESDFFSKPY